jgi:hypothetical protein
MHERPKPHIKHLRLARPGSANMCPGGTEGGSAPQAHHHPTRSRWHPAAMSRGQQQAQAAGSKQQAASSQQQPPLAAAAAVPSCGSQQLLPAAAASVPVRYRYGLLDLASSYYRYSRERLRSSNCNGATGLQLYRHGKQAGACSPESRRCTVSRRDRVRRLRSLLEPLIRVFRPKEVN